MPKTPASPLLEKVKEIQAPEYSAEEQQYYDRLVGRIVRARDERDQPHQEFDGLTWLEYIESNRKLANTFVEPKRTKADNNFSAGTVRSKIEAYLAAVMNLDLSPDIEAFDKENRPVAELGEGMEDILASIAERDGEGGDREKQMLRFYSLFEQGTVFVREAWVTGKKPVKSMQGKFTGKLDSAKWTTRMEDILAHPRRDIVLPENVILGNIREFEMAKQPFIVDIDILSRAEAEERYGTWDRWQNVPEQVTDVLSTSRGGKKYEPFKLYDSTNKGDVEVVRYQDAHSNEQAIFLNGVLMTPVGLPMYTEGYDIAKQTLGIISTHFAYGKSMPHRLKNNALLLDEMMRLALKKTQKAFAPPLYNNTSKVLTRSVFDPGRITSNIKADQLGVIDPNARSVESGEIAVINMIESKIDEKSVNPVFAGQQPSGNPTATQVLEVQKQAKMVIELTVTACTLLEFKLTWLRIHNVLTHWFEPTGNTYNEFTQEYAQKYRSVAIAKYLPGVGKGIKMVKMASPVPDAKAVYQEEEALSTKDRPVRISYFDPKEIQAAKHLWSAAVLPKERKSDAMKKVLFNEFKNGALELGGSVAYLGERYAEVWEENPAKVFPQQQPAPAGAEMPGSGNAAGIPKMPQPKQGNSALMNQAIKSV